MSRVGKLPVSIPSGVECKLENGTFKVKGPLGQLVYNVSDAVVVEIKDGKVLVDPKVKDKTGRTMWGTTRALINNMIHGISKGYTINLEINGVGYRAAIEGKTLVLQLGYSHDVRFDPPEGITIKCEKPTAIAISGSNKQVVGQVAAVIRSYRPPEPYKGKGIKRQDEIVLRKEGKKK
jgi:large subunit ribosomal protein L6